MKTDYGYGSHAGPSNRKSEDKAAALALDPGAGHKKHSRFTFYDGDPGSSV